MMADGLPHSCNRVRSKPATLDHSWQRLAGRKSKAHIGLRTATNKPGSERKMPVWASLIDRDQANRPAAVIGPQAIWRTPNPRGLLV